MSVSNGAITGTLKKLESGQLVTDWGEGYFMALKFANEDLDYSHIQVGLYPSEGVGMVTLDSDMDGVFKVTDKDNQVLRVITRDGSISTTDDYILSGLTLAE